MSQDKQPADGGQAKTTPTTNPQEKQIGERSELSQPADIELKADDPEDHDVKCGCHACCRKRSWLALKHKAKNPPQVPLKPPQVFLEEASNKGIESNKTDSAEMIIDEPAWGKRP